MNNTDEQTATILAHYGLAANGNVWQVEGQIFIHHRALERIAAQAKITFDHPPCFAPSATKPPCLWLAGWVIAPSGPSERHSWT